MKPIITHKFFLTGLLLWLALGVLPLPFFRHTAGKVLCFELLLLLLLLRLAVWNKEFVLPRALLLLLPLLFTLGVSTLLSPAHDGQVELLLLASLVIMPVLLWPFLQKLEYADFHRLFVIVGLVVALLGFYEYFHFQAYGTSATPLIPYLLPAKFAARLVGPFGQSNFFALFLNCALLAAIYRAVHSGGAAQRWPANYVIFLPVVLLAFLLIQAGSRAGYLALAIVLLLLCWFIARGSYLSDDNAARKRFYWCLGLILTVNLFVWYLDSASGDSLTTGVSGFSADARFVFWLTALLIFKANLLFGAGLGQYKLLMAKYGIVSHDLLGFVSYESIATTDWAHNDFFQILAEGGAAAGLLVLLLLFYVLRLYRQRKGFESEANLYLYGMLAIFLIQSMFSYPLHNFTLLAIFMFVLTMIFSSDRSYHFSITPPIRLALLVLVVCWVALIGWYAVNEYQVGRFKRDLISRAPLEQTLPQFMALAQNGYAERMILSKTIPHYLNRALAMESPEFARLLVPYAERLIQIEGSGEQWYNLALLHAHLKQDAAARAALKRALALKPLDSRLWGLLHYLDMRKAARATGQPIENFYPRGQQYRLNQLGD